MYGHYIKNKQDSKAEEKMQISEEPWDRSYRTDCNEVPVFSICFIYPGLGVKEASNPVTLIGTGEKSPQSLLFLAENRERTA